LTQSLGQPCEILPSGWLLGFGHTPLGRLGLPGLWVGNLMGFAFMFVCLGGYFLRIDWREQSRLA
jgi:Na+-driven multidrug efflux pump